MEALGKVLRREIPWRQHAHRADDIVTALRIQAEFGYDLVIDHGTEAHVVADLLAERGVPVLIGPLFTTKSKMELRKRSIANPGKLATAGVELSIITDHPVIPISFLVLQASLAVREGLDRETALRAITINPAKVLGIADQVGSLEPGKRADLVVWGGDWMDPMARPRTVLIDGRIVFEHDAATGEERVADRAEVPLALDAPAALVRNLDAPTRVRLPRSVIDSADARALPGAHDVEEDASDVLISTRTPATVVAALAASNQLDGVSLRTATLEDVFLDLTGREYRE